MKNKGKSYSAVIADCLGNNYYIRDMNSYYYEDYISLYKKQEVTGDIEIETKDDFASYYITNEDGKIISCCAIAPYTHLKINICDNFNLYTYSEALQIKKSVISIIVDNHFLFTALFIIIPFTILTIISLNFNKYIMIIFIIYLALLLYFVYYKKTCYIRNLEKKRDEFLAAYFKGKKDNDE